MIHTFPLSLGRLPLAAVQQVVTVTGLAVVAVFQHLYVALDVDESLGLQFVQCPSCCGLRTSAGIGDGSDPCLTSVPTSGTGSQVAVNCQFIRCQPIVKNCGAHLEILFTKNRLLLLQLSD